MIAKRRDQNRMPKTMGGITEKEKTMNVRRVAKSSPNRTEENTVKNHEEAVGGHGLGCNSMVSCAPKENRVLL